MARNKYPEETINLILEEARKLFIEKGYEHTSIQDLINNLGGLSKGAIYHHFQSKEEIFEAVCAQIGNENMVYYNTMRDDQSKNGYEKLKAMMKATYENPNNKAIISMSNKIVSDPKFLMNQMNEIYEVVAPLYIEPIIKQGIDDGSIVTDYAKELAEVLITLLNIWINPIIAVSTPAQLRKKVEFFDLLLKGVGIDLIDEEIITQIVLYCESYSL